MGRGILIILCGFIVVFGIVEASLRHRQNTLSGRTSNYYYAEQSRNIAFSTMEAAVGKFNNDHSWNPQETKWDSVVHGTGIINLDSSKYVHSRLFVTIKGKIGGYTTTINAVINRPAFSIYAYFTNRETLPNGDPIYFTTRDVLTGPVHTNGTFHIQGDPVFNGPVSSPHDPDISGGSDPQFNGGTDFNASVIHLPEDLSDITEAAKDGSYSFGNDKIKIVFKVINKENGGKKGVAEITSYEPTGTKRICVEWWRGWVGGYCLDYETVPTYSSTGTTQNYDLQHSDDFNGFISTKGPIEVKGTLKGDVTVHSKRSIHIIGDLTYKDFDPDHPDKKLSSNNLLGLVSEGDVIIDDGAEKHQNSVTAGITSDQSDVYITASIMTSNGSFTVEDYRSGGSRGKIYLLGGVIQKRRGPVGLVGGVGYTKHYTYDKRFKTNSTPYFPKITRFSVGSWRETTK